MKSKRIVLNMMLAVFFSVGLSSVVFAEHENPKLHKIVENWWLDHAKDVNAPSFVSGVVENGVLINFKAHGYSDVDASKFPHQDTIYRIGSLSKVFTAIGILQLRDLGKIRLDDYLSQHIPELTKLTYLSPQSPRITIRDLLTHTSALPRMAEGGDWLLIGELIRTSSNIVLKANPGDRFSYSNLAFALLGEVIARVSGMTWEQYTRQNILQPLDMSNTYFHENEFSKEQMAVPYTPNQNSGWLAINSPELYGYASAGTIYSTIPDLAKFMAMSYELAPSPKYDTILRTSSRNEMVRPQYVTNISEGSAMGFPWFISTNKNGAQSIGHGGNIDGFECSFVFDPHRKIGVIILANNIYSGLNVVGLQLLDVVRKSRVQTESKIMRDVASRLLIALNDPIEDNFRNVMTDQILSNGGVELFKTVFQQQKDQLGAAESFTSLKIKDPKNFSVSIVYFNAANNNRKSEVTLDVFIDESNPAKIIGIWRL